ncbi:MAG: hypothetical protein B7Y45_07865 [Sphingomonas sp. 28-66-16]|nr:MAG: hypothetical protein B7Y45_07865 [Sphingomonas sp. 28-66-16]
MTDEPSARLALPLLQPGQAQKELYHNEALALLDLAVQPVVLSVGLDSPPADPMPGQCWIVGSAPIGAWAGRANALAGWTAGGWRFVAACDGMVAWSLADGLLARAEDGGWTLGETRCSRVIVGDDRVVGPRQPAIADPAGGTTIDVEARATLGAILAALRAHGLIAL